MKRWPKYHFVLFAIVIISSFESPAAFKFVFTTRLPAPQHSLCRVNLTSKTPVAVATCSAHTLPLSGGKKHLKEHSCISLNCIDTCMCEWTSHYQTETKSMYIAPYSVSCVSTSMYMEKKKYVCLEPCVASDDVEVLPLGFYVSLSSFYVSLSSP